MYVGKVVNLTRLLRVCKEKKWKTSKIQKNHTIASCHVIDIDVYPGSSTFVQGFLEITTLTFVLVDMGSTREEKLMSMY